MARTRRRSIGDVCYHVINRGNRKERVFHDDVDYRRFIHLLTLANERVPIRALAWCLMPNHFHLLIWPWADGDLSRWMQWLMTTHVRRHHLRYDTTGRIWQGRYKAFPVQQDHHLITVLRYVERNPLRAGLVERAEHWPWSSLSNRVSGQMPVFWHAGPTPRPVDWVGYVNQPERKGELAKLQRCAQRQTPFGDEAWVLSTARQLGLMWTIRSRGRPRLEQKKESVPIGSPIGSHRSGRPHPG